ncbi:unnamed protein product [Adineta ricciae]|uniref:monoamine oxidase n=1 Tax=Adineta ricciae TaxID=249248 RepID=A0A815VC90_ADIRI|nr:unnamed protein product [Adineta ricciae]
MSNIESFDVIIIGAGFAGLSAAKYLTSKSVRCLVIEGRARIGGRTLSEKVFDEKWTIDLGGQWIGPKQKRVLSLIDQFNLHLVEQTWYHQDPSHLGQQLGLSPLTNDQLDAIEKICSECDTMSLELADVEHALEYEKSSEWSQISVAQFIHDHPLVKDYRTEQELKLHILTLTACDAENVSLLYWLILIRSIPGGLNSLDDGLNGAQHYKISSGTQNLCYRMSEHENIRLNDPLVSINYQSNDEILLKMKSGVEIQCRRLLLAFSPSLLSTIDFCPSLSTNNYCSMTMGQCIKTIFIYSKPFWRNILVDQTDKQGPCSNIFESNYPIALIGLVLGERASYWCKRDQNELIESIIEQYSVLYNTNEKPLQTFVQYWPKESLSKGCYAAVYPASPCSTWRNRTKALIDGRIWLASTEMALEWIGYIEGAIEAGERFAEEIHRTL